MTDTIEDRASGIPAPKFVSGFCQEQRRRLILVAAILASAMGFIDGSVIAIAIPAIRETLDASLIQVQWVHNAYLLTLSALTLVGGAFGDRFGLARIFGLGIAVFVISSVICALAPSPEVLIPARAIQGLGAAMMIPGSLAIISRAYPRETRGAAIGTWAAASAVTTAAGPIIGAGVLTVGGAEMWRWVFAINVPMGALAIWLLVRAVEKDPARAGERVDLMGAALATLALGGLAWGLTGGHGTILWPYIGFGLAALLAFLWVEARQSAPMMELTLFASRAFSAVNAMTFSFYFAFSTIMFFLPMVVISGWGLREIDTAAAFAPLSIFIGGFSSRVGRLADRYGPRPFLAAGSAIVAVAFTALALVIPNQVFWYQVVPATTLMGFGMALLVAPLSTAVMASVDDAHAGSASGVNNALARMAGLFSVAAMGSLAAVIYTQAGGPLSFGAADLDPAHVAAMNTAFAAIIWVSAGLAALSSVLIWIGPCDLASLSAGDL
ncbi:MAG: MFS transporter [Pseudomonadota bacterium]